MLCSKGVGDGPVRGEGWEMAGALGGGGDVEKTRLPRKGFRGYE